MLWGKSKVMFEEETSRGPGGMFPVFDEVFLVKGIQTQLRRMSLLHNLVFVEAEG